MMNVNLFLQVKKMGLTLLLFVTCCPLSLNATSTDKDFKKLMQGFLEEEEVSTNLLKTAANWQADGSFSDINYDDTSITKWAPIAHLERLNAFAQAYVTPGTDFYENDRVFDQIVKALSFWQTKNPESKNWWHNQIGEPQEMGILLIQLRNGKRQLPTDLEQAIIERMKTDGGDPEVKTGANKTDISLHWLYRACLTKDEGLLRRAVGYIYEPIAYTTAEGFQYDNSYFQHGNQLYIGGYGDEILKTATRIAAITAGTQFEMPTEKVALLSHFMRNTYFKSIRGQYMLYDVMGRSVSRPNILDKSGMAILAKRMLKVDPKNKKEFSDIIDRLKGNATPDTGIKASHTHYYIGDYTLHVRPEYHFDVRLASVRTSKNEYGNNENLKGYFLSDGATSMTIDGDEYFNIFPTWDWAHIPGVTAPHLNDIPLNANAWQTPGSSTFAGGVSDSLIGATAYSYHDTRQEVNTQARKSWFFFDKEIVCLGAGIQSTVDAPVHTTVNQCLQNSRDVEVNDGKNVRTIAGNSEVVEGANWVYHNKMGYVFPMKQTVFVSNMVQQGTWQSINRSRSNKTEQRPVVTIGINHGIHPKEASYAYIVVPNVLTADDLDSYARKTPIDILINTSEQQAVYHRKQDVLMISFFKAGTLTTEKGRFTADKPCVVMVRNLEGKRPALYVADPAQTALPISVAIEGKKNKMEWTADFSVKGIHPGMTLKY